MSRDVGLGNLGAILILLFFLVTPRQSCGQTASPIPSQKITIHGVVVNTVTHEPVGHALVFSGDGRLGTFTDDAGRFEFVLPQSADAGLRDGASGSEVTVSYRGTGIPGLLYARKPGFLGPSNFYGRWNQNPPNGVAPTPGVELTIPLTPEALIFGRVNLPGATGADWMEVELHRRQIVDGRPHWEEVTWVMTRGDGGFRFFGLEAGHYKLLTSEVKDRDPLTADPHGPTMGYPPAYFPNANDFQSAGTIDLKAGATFEAELSPVRQAYYPVKIPITNPDYVQVTVEGQKGPGFELGYNQEEQRIEGSLPNGTYVVKALIPADSKVMSGSESIVIKGAPLEAPAMTLLPSSSLRVKTKLEFRQNSEASRENRPEDFRPLEARGRDLIVRLDPTDESMNSGASSSWPVNDMTLAQLLPGQYWVRIDALRGYVATAVSGDVDLLRKPLTVGAAETAVVEVTLRDDGAEISGTIEGMGGSGDPGGGEASTTVGTAYVYCVPLPDGTGQFRQTQIGRDGKFDLEQIAPGAYRVMAFAHPQSEMEYQNTEAMRAYDGIGQVIRVNAGQKESVRLPLVAGSE